MYRNFADRIYQGKMTRRDFIQLMMVSTSGVAMSGCAVNPVSGSRQLMLLSEQQEIAIDKEQAPHQFSNDYGLIQDDAVKRYITQVSQQMSTKSHRPNMPYNFNAVNATYVNAYAFPGGTVAATRGILVELENEAELAGLMGHELGHINARHSAQRASQTMLTEALVAAGGAIVGTNYGNAYADVVQSLGSVASGALLAKYSRDNEREADNLGMEYMTRAEQNPQGMVGLMEVLVRQSKHNPSALEQMFASHPLSSERYNTAKESISTHYASAAKMPLNRERYMDNIASLRQIKPAITAMQQGEAQMSKEAYQVAETDFNTALKYAPNDYAGLVMMAKCQLALKQNDKAQRYVEQAKLINPAEAQAQHISGLTLLAQNHPDAAYNAFQQYERLLPGNPNTVFLQAVSLEAMQRKEASAQQYGRYLRQADKNMQSMQAQHATQRLQSWGYVKQQ
jgi:predicted Zn-dependent protease